MKSEDPNIIIKKISLLFNIDESHAGCYLCNYLDKYICIEYKNGCKKLEQCKQIHKKLEEYINK